MKKPTVRVETPHSDYQAPGSAHDWVVLGETEWRAKDGSKRGRHHLWLVAICNDDRCSARALIDAWGVAALVS